MPHKDHKARKNLLRDADAHRARMNDIRSQRPTQAPHGMPSIGGDDTKLPPEMREALVLALVCTVIGILFVMVGVAILKMAGVL